MLPFKSALLEAATGIERPITAAAIGYSVSEGSVPDEVCYWREMTLLPHLANLLTKGELHARVLFAEQQNLAANRKELARQLHSAVKSLRSRCERSRSADLG